MESLTSGSATVALVFTLLTYTLSTALYRLFFHPLSRFPGPKLAAVTRYYEAYYDVVQNGQYTFKIADLHARYGPIVRISPHELHVNDHSFYDKLYRQDGRWNRYDWTYDAFTAELSTICSIDHDAHKRRRAPMNAFFSKATVSKRQSVIQARLDRLCERIREYEASGQILNLGTAISAFTGDVGTEYIIGKSYDNLDRQDFNASMTSVLQASGALWRITKHVRLLGPTLHKLPEFVVKNMLDRGTKAFFAFISELQKTICAIMSSEADESTIDTAPTLIHTILRSNLPPEEKTFGRLSDELSTVLGAALETTAQTMRVALYFVYSNRSILNQLRAELATAAEDSSRSSEAMSLKTLEQLPYLTAVLTESLRLSPGAATRLARIAPDRPLVYDKWTIPAGTPIGMTTLLLHTDERVYPDAQGFHPERWLDAEQRKKVDGVFAPFSRGTRNCIGMHLAWAELYMTVAALVQRFDFTFDGAGPKDVVPASDQFIIGTKDSSGLKVYVSSAAG